MKTTYLLFLLLLLAQAAKADEHRLSPEDAAKQDYSHELPATKKASAADAHAEAPAHAADAHGEAPAHAADAHGEAPAHAHAEEAHHENPADAHSGHHAEAAPKHEKAPARVIPLSLATPADRTPGPVVAVETKTGKPVRAGVLINTGSQVHFFTDKFNTRVEISPYSVAEFTAEGELRLLRGSASLENARERRMHTSSAHVDFAGNLLVSYDHKEKSTSAFVLAGEGRIQNAFDASRSLRLDRFRGATMVVGDVVPQLVRQLDVGAVEQWLNGYAWPEAQRQRLLNLMPKGDLAKAPVTPGHLQETKLEDYFSSVESEEDLNAPDYYDRKFADPEKVIAEQNSEKDKSKVLSPEQAALISLPSTKIDLGFELGPEILSSRQKEEEVYTAKERETVRRLASVAKERAAAAPAEKAPPIHSDPEIAAVLSRLKSVERKDPVVSRLPLISPVSSAAASGRRPASSGPDTVPDIVYDYSENF